MTVSMDAQIDIEAICSELKVSQVEVSKATGVTQGAVSRWRPGQNQPNGAARILLERFIDEKRRERAAA